MKILVTGSSGFIGFFLSKRLLEMGHEVVGFDCENDYYDVSLKHARRQILLDFPGFTFVSGHLEKFEELAKVFQDHKIDKVCNLAAQAGVRYSIENPFAYIESNLVGFHNLLNLANTYKVQTFVYASSSSVYGKNEKQPFSIDDRVDHPISLYAATKKSNELIAHTYSHLYGLRTIGLRFFTVYGPYSRPDMAMLKFALKMKRGEEIDVYNFGDMKRDFTYIDDIVEGILKALDYTDTTYEFFNLGNDEPVQLEYMIDLLEQAIGIKALKHYLPMQPGDVPSTWSDIDYTKEKLGWTPTTSIQEGISKFGEWFLEYYSTSLER